MTSDHRHPLEPLSTAEGQQAARLLRDHGKVTPTTRFVSVSLKEPPKEVVHIPGGRGAVPREAYVLLFDNGTNTAHEATLSLTRGELLSFRSRTGVQPTMTIDEQVECEQAVLSSPEFQAALKKHYGVEDTNLVMVDIWSAGYYGSEEDRTRRLARPLCFLRSDPSDNGYAKPIEGLRPVVDLNAMRVLRVEEYGHWPLRPQQSNYAPDRTEPSRTDISPPKITHRRDRASRLKGNASAGRSGASSSASTPAKGSPSTTSATTTTASSARSCTAHHSPKWSCPMATRRRSRRAKTRSTPVSMASACAP